MAKGLLFYSNPRSYILAFFSLNRNWFTGRKLDRARIFAVNVLAKKDSF